MVASKFKQMLQDENGVSPVIGVILMVAVTVVLGAVIGAFVFGIGDSLGQPAPNAQFDFDYSASAGTVDIYHDGGDSITPDNTGKLTFSTTDGGADANPLAVSPETTKSYLDAGGVVAGPIATGDIVGSDDAGNVGSGDTISIQWQSVDGGTSSTLGSFEAS